MPRLTKTKLAIPALIVLLTAGAGGYQLWSQRQARAALDATLASLPAGSRGHYDSMSFNAFTQTLRIGGLAITRDGHPALTVQQVTLHHLSGSGTLADPVQASSVRLLGTELWRASHSLTAAVVDAENVKVLAPDVAPPPGTPRWLVAPGSGTLFAAGAMSANTIADNEGATVSALSIADYDDGQLRQASARGFADAHGNRVASVAVDEVDLDGLDAVFDTGRYGSGEPSWPAPRRLIGHAEIMGLQSRNETATATIARIALDSFAARPFAAAPNSTYVKTQAFLRDAAAAVSVGAASITGLRYADSRTKLSGMLNALSLFGYSDGALAQASLDGLAFSGISPSQVAVGHFEMVGLNATKLLQAIAGESPLTLVEAARHGGVHLTSLALTKVSVTPATGQTITLDSADQSTTGTAPTHFTARLRGLSIPARSNPELAQGLGALGVDRLVFDLDETGAYDPAAGTAALDPLVLTARGLASLSLSAQFTGVPDDLPQTGSPLAALAGMNIGPFVLHFTNDGLVQRVVAMEARQAGKTPQEVTDVGEARRLVRRRRAGARSGGCGPAGRGLHRRSARADDHRNACGPHSIRHVPGNGTGHGEERA